MANQVWHKFCYSSILLENLRSLIYTCFVHNPMQRTPLALHTLLNFLRCLNSFVSQVMANQVQGGTDIRTILVSVSFRDEIRSVHKLDDQYLTLILDRDKLLGKQPCLRPKSSNCDTATTRFSSICISTASLAVIYAYDDI